MTIDIKYLRSKLRILNISVIDYALMYVIVFLTLLATGSRLHPVYFAGILPISVIVHSLFNVDTYIMQQVKLPTLNPSKVFVGIYTLIFLFFTVKCHSS
jgi:hypothetical protein